MALSSTLRGLVPKLVRDPPYTNHTTGRAHSAVQQRAPLLIVQFLFFTSSSTTPHTTKWNSIITQIAKPHRPGGVEGGGSVYMKLPTASH